MHVKRRERFGSPEVKMHFLLKVPTNRTYRGKARELMMTELIPGDQAAVLGRGFCDDDGSDSPTLRPSLKTQK